ncbi:MAG: Uncharacterized protein G01um101431_908 [Parcubacteria group bacterium Gr01-1014_31]|nr:MAG: Uncharacterized protein G01um101431_908 [Parcubacteria group bacterium Gr01-1014_31]
MQEVIDEPIEVLASFSPVLACVDRPVVKPRIAGNKVMPLVFRWRGKKYQVEKLNLVHRERDGEDIIYYFNVSDAANYFKLAFSTRRLSWRLSEWYATG